MSQGTAATITPPLTVVCTGASSAIVTVTAWFTSMALAGVLGHNGMVLLPPLTLIDTMGDVAGFTVLL